MTTSTQLDSQARARYVAQLRRAADLIEQFELPVQHQANINVPIVLLPDDEADAILTATAERIGMPVDRTTPSQPGIEIDLGDGGVYRIYLFTAARTAAYAKAVVAIDGWDEGLDDPAEPASVLDDPTAEEPQPATSVEREIEARATEGGKTPYDASVEDAPELPNLLHCPRCDHTEYASEEDPDAGLSQMHNHILWEHAGRNFDTTRVLLAQVRAEAEKAG